MILYTQKEFFALLKRERIRLNNYRSKAKGEAAIFNYIKLRHHENINNLSPMEYEKNCFLKQSCF